MSDFYEAKPIPVVPLRGGAVFPGVTTTVSIGRRTSLAAVQAAIERGGELLVVVQRDAEVETPGTEDVFPIAILATARDMLRTPVGIQMLVELHRRVQVTGIDGNDPFLIGRYEELAGLIQERYGYSREEAHNELDMFLNNIETRDM